MLAIEYNSKYISEGRNNLEQFDYSIGLSRLAFLKDNTFDNELTLSISREYSNQIYTAANFTYSTQQQGPLLKLNLHAQ